LKGAAEVYVVDNVAELAPSLSISAPGRSSRADFEIRQKHHGIQQSRRPGEEKLWGADCAIDAVGR